MKVRKLDDISSEAYKTMNPWEAIWYALYDENIETVSDGNKKIWLVKTHLIDGEPVWRRATEKDQLVGDEENEIQ